MSESLIERLRATTPKDSGYAELANEAADRLEAAQALLNAAKARVDIPAA